MLGALVVGWVLAAAAVLGCLWLTLSRREARTQLSLRAAECAKLQELAERYAVDVQRAEDALERAREQLESNEPAIAHARATLEALQGKVDRYFKCIATIERERDEWARVAGDAIVGHQKAQELMMAEIKRLATKVGQMRDLLAREPPAAEHDQWLARLRKLASTRMDARVERVFAEFSAEFDPDAGRPAKIERAPGQKSVEEPQPGLSAIT